MLQRDMFHDKQVGKVREPDIEPDDEDDDPDVATDDDRSCTCYRDGLHSPGSVAAARLGNTDPECPLHGEDR